MSGAPRRALSRMDERDDLPDMQPSYGELVAVLTSLRPNTDTSTHRPEKGACCFAQTTSSNPSCLLYTGADDVHYNAAELSALASSRPYAEAAAKEKGVPVT
jgi:hypothetical protein